MNSVSYGLIAREVERYVLQLEEMKIIINVGLESTLATAPLCPFNHPL